METCNVAVIGAGPYGLSASAYLRTIPGLEIQTFGAPMSFWDQNMPKGMLLRSNWTATQISDPEGALTLEAYQAATGDRFSTPVPLSSFVQYGRWYQRRAVPDLDQRSVARIESYAQGFRVRLDDGEAVCARRVIVAVGIGAFAWRPPEFQKLPPWLVSHASEHSDLGRFAGSRVLVVGGGQSALESAALLHENGAQVEVIARSTRIHWLQGRLSRTLHHGLGKLTSRLLYAPTDVGPAGISQLVARPHLLRRLPRPLQNKLRRRAVRPAGARWLQSRLKAVPLRLGRSVVSAAAAGDRVQVRLDDGSERIVDHVLLGTGYRIDISKYEFLASELLKCIHRVHGFPVLTEGFETSVPGLHIIGAPAAWSFGPLMQFVSGTTYTSRALLRALAKDKPVMAGRGALV